MYSSVVLVTLRRPPFAMYQVYTFVFTFFFEYGRGRQFCSSLLVYLTNLFSVSLLMIKIMLSQEVFAGSYSETTNIQHMTDHDGARYNGNNMPHNGQHNRNGSYGIMHDSHHLSDPHRIHNSNSWRSERQDGWRNECKSTLLFCAVRYCLFKYRISKS